ncbi:MAG: hypothetical protein QM750_11685 [Rubrivivax sp.]
MLQAPIAAPRYCVLYLVSGKERASPWLYRRDHALVALAALQRRYGDRNAVLLAD